MRRNGKERHRLHTHFQVVPEVNKARGQPLHDTALEAHLLHIHKLGTGHQQNQSLTLNMPLNLSVDEYVEFLQSPQVTLVVGDDPQERIPIHVFFLVYHSPHFVGSWKDNIAGMESESGVKFCQTLRASQNSSSLTTMVIPEARTDTIEEFVHWCYTSTLTKLPSTQASATFQAAKALLLDLWLFCDTYAIRELQNEVMRQLCDLLTLDPHALVMDDIETIFARSLESKNDELKQFAIVALVAKAADTSKNAKKSNKVSIKECFSLSQRYYDFSPLLNSTLQKWRGFPFKEFALRQEVELTRRVRVDMFLRETEMIARVAVQVDPVIPEWIVKLCGLELEDGSQECSVLRGGRWR